MFTSLSEDHSLAATALRIFFKNVFDWRVSNDIEHHDNGDITLTVDGQTLRVSENDGTMEELTVKMDKWTEAVVAYRFKLDAYRARHTDRTGFHGDPNWRPEPVSV